MHVALNNLALDVKILKEFLAVYEPRKGKP